MSKTSLYLIVAIALAITAATFFVNGRNTHRSCFVNDDIISGQVRQGEAVSQEDSPPVYATVRGFPLWYYQEPMPANCISADGTVDGATVGSAFNTIHLAYDLLIWLIVATVLFLPSVFMKMWRGPRMLGDRVRRRA